ncbi:DsbA family protein [Sulfurimonas marina]|uniref:Disulfide bond formation protein DsbA n=1 Tax=Sulfurimonas marina TaxID=2590551 RepID=A0A7M1AU47_9BACT|nr:thioredoxin domain-containing protein [Sulfurimonas marina]QOP40953.1 disulfide bond formation protein DsbA [Sulfurimonas marina]
MLSTLRLLSITVLLSSVLSANTNEKIEEFLTDKFEENKRIESIEVKVKERVPLKELKGWNGYIVEVEAYLKENPKRQVKQRMVWFSNGQMITKELTDMDSGRSLVEKVKPKFESRFYKKENLIYGDANSKHKVALFSDPLCPFCKGFVPGAIKDMKKDPKKFAVYYYHMPLERIHPASVHIVKMAAAAELKGVKDVTLKMYDIKINPREKDVNKILEAFNKAVGTTLTQKDINTPKVLQHVNSDFDIANELMVAGTPTVYVDGKLDETKKGYKKVK